MQNILNNGKGLAWLNKTIYSNSVICHSVICMFCRTKDDCLKWLQMTISQTLATSNSSKNSQIISLPAEKSSKTPKWLQSVRLCLVHGIWILQIFKMCELSLNQKVGKSIAPFNNKISWYLTNQAASCHLAVKHKLNTLQTTYAEYHGQFHQ